VSTGAWDGPRTRATCPYCGCKECEADWVDVEVGMIQCGPYVCPNCCASEVGPHDKNELDAEEKRTGWFKPMHLGTSANTFQGQHIDHRTAKGLYRAGFAINTHREDEQ
jgi:hypothetical protein